MSSSAPIDRRTFICLVGSAAVVAGCGNARLAGTPKSAGPLVSVAAGSLPRPDHVVVVIFENKDRDEVVGSGDAPYLTSLAERGAYFTDSHGLTHPSQPNYVGMLAGTTLGVYDNDCLYDLGDVPNLVQQLLEKGISVAGYFEGLPSAGFRGCESRDELYVRKHNPFADFSNIPDSAILPFSKFPANLADLPTVAFVVPDMCNSMHDCPVYVGDEWMEHELSDYATWASTHNSLLIVTFDEDNGSDENLIPTIFFGEMVEPGIYSQRIDHYNVLRTIEEMYGLSPLGDAAAAEPVIAWKV